MFIMMPKVQCADGSRVKNIKKHFEVLSHEATSETDTKFKCSSTQLSEKTTGRQHSTSNLNSLVCKDESKNCKNNVPLKESVVKNDKCSIKRTPAFRCDKIVKGKIVTGQGKDKHKYVEDKVKLFEDGGMRISESTTGRSQVVPELSNNRKSGEFKVIQAADKMKRNPEIPKRTYPSGDIVNAITRKTSPEAKISSHLNVFETKVIFPSSLKSPSGDVSSNKLKPVRNGDFIRDNTQVTPRSVTSKEDNLKDILKSPLPRGPPPRKPPRTFAHGSQSVTQLNALQKNSKSPKVGTKEFSGTSPDGTSAIPALVRSKTESQIELRNKLETVLSKLQAGEHLPQSSGRSPQVEANKKNFTHPCRTRPPNKPDISPSSLLVGCLSLGCVSNHQYEEVGAGRQSQFFAGPSDRRERMDIRSSLIDATETNNTSGSLLRSQSEDHIYAVPFGDVKLQEVRLPKPEVSPQNHSKDIKNQSDESSKRHKDVNGLDSTGLHYMCTPILTSENLHNFNTHEEYTHVGGIQGQIRSGALKHVSPFRNFPNAKEFENSAKVTNKMSQVNGNSEGSFQEDGKETRLTVKVGQDGFNNGSKSSLCSPSTENEEENGEEEHDAVTEEIVEQRKGYVRRMCSIFQKFEMENSSPSQGPVAAANLNGRNAPNLKTSPTKQSALQAPYAVCNSNSSASSQHLFECVLLVGLTLSSDSDEVKSYEPYIKSKFPANVLVPPWIEHLCFPDASDWAIPKSVSSSKAGQAEDSKRKDSKGDDGMINTACRDQTYSLVITGPDGSRRFGYCRRVLPEGGSICLPLNYCLISPYRANGFYFKVLAELESRHGQPESERNAFLQELYSCPLPGPGQVPCPPSSSPPLSAFVASLRRPLDTRLEERDVMELLTCLEVSVFLDVFASLLLERKVLLTSKYLSKLSSCVEALQSVLYPFSWQHTFIPVLPAPMLDVCSAPTPYIIGVLKGSNGQVPNITLDEGIMVDLDTSHCLQKVGDEGSILPGRMKRALQSALRIVSGLNNSQQNSSKKNSSPEGGTPVCNVLVSEAFLRTFLLVIGHYPNHIITHKDGHKTFQRETFIEAMPFSGVKMFLEWFTETAMFSAFINASLEGGSGDSIFEKRAQKFCEEAEKDSLLFLKTYKNLIKKNKTFGDRLKDWTPFA